MERLRPSKVIVLTDVPKSLLDKRIIRRHFSLFGTVKRVAIDPETLCCSVCFSSIEEAQSAYMHGGVINNVEVKIRLGTTETSSNIQLQDAPIRDTHSYDDLDLQFLEDDNEVFGVEDRVDMDEDNHSNRELFKMKKKIIRKLHDERKENPKMAEKRTKKTSPDSKSNALTSVKRAKEKSSKLLKKPTTAMTSADLSKVKRLKQKFETLNRRDKVYRETLKTRKLNIKTGTCPDMCPEKERIMRASRKLWAKFETREGINKLVPELAVKKYSRSSANQEEPLPHELRPEPVLTMTMNYLVLKIMPFIENREVNLSEWYDFLWDRLRGIRKDIVQQQLCSVATAKIIEQCARFHILCFDRLCGLDAAIFDEKINTENLNNCLQSLIDMYDDLSERGLQCPNEAEFRAYEILTKLERGDIIWEFQQLAPHLQTSPEILFALQVFAAFNNNMYSKFFKLVKGTTYLNACLLQRYFGVIRSKALPTIITTFCRPQDQSFKVSVIFLRTMLQFDTDEDVLNFCTSHGMAESGDGELSIGKYDVKFPSNTSSLARSLNIVVAKRLSLPVTVTSSTELPSLIEHKVHSSFDSSGKLNKDALNAKDQIFKLKTDFNFEVKNMPNVEINESLMAQDEGEISVPEYSEPKELKESTVKHSSKSNVFSRLSYSSEESSVFLKPSIKPTFGSKSYSESEPFSNNPFKKDNRLPSAKLSKSPPKISGPFINDNRTLSEGTNIFKKPTMPSLEPKLFKSNTVDSDIFKKPLPPSNIFTKAAIESNPFQKSTIESTPFQKPNPFQKPSAESNIFAKPISDSIGQKTSLFSKVETDSNVFEKPATDINVFKKSTSYVNPFKSNETNASTSINIFKSTSSMPDGASMNIFRTATDKATTDSFPITTNIFGKPSHDESSEKPCSNVFNKFSSNISTGPKESSFALFMNPQPASQNIQKTESSFNFLQKMSEIKNKPDESFATGINAISSGFEKSYEMFLKNSEQETRKRIADEEKELERQREFEALQKEKERQRQTELEKQKQIEMQKQRERELEAQRQKEIELKRQRELELQRKKEFEAQTERERELQRLREIELKKQKEWEDQVKQNILSLQVHFDLQYVLNNLEQEEKNKMKEHELLVIRLKKEKELRKLRKIVKKKIKFIHARRCLKKWKEHVAKLKINQLDFPNYVLSSVENHTAVWGSVKHIENHLPFNMEQRIENIQKIYKNPILSTDNLYLGDSYMNFISKSNIYPKIIQENCTFSSNLYWKVLFHLPKLNEDFSKVKLELIEFLNKLCYDNKNNLNQIECKKVLNYNLYSSYYLYENDLTNRNNSQGSHVCIFIISELWETLNESIQRFISVINTIDFYTTSITILTYRSHYNLDMLKEKFENELINSNLENNKTNTNLNLNIIKWNSANDIYSLIFNQFKLYFNNNTPLPLYYNCLYEILINELETLFYQIKLDSNINICKSDFYKQFKSPNYFINLYNNLLYKLKYIITKTNINIGKEYENYLFNKKQIQSNEIIILNNDHNEIDNFISKLLLPIIKNYPVDNIYKFQKVLKKFTNKIDLSNNDQLFSNIIRQINPPKDNFHIYIEKINWNDIILECILCHLKHNYQYLHKIYMFYGKKYFNEKIRNHWWMKM